MDASSDDKKFHITIVKYERSQERTFAVQRGQFHISVAYLQNPNLSFKLFWINQKLGNLLKR